MRIPVFFFSLHLFHINKLGLPLILACLHNKINRIPFLIYLFFCMPQLDPISIWSEKKSQISVGVYGKALLLSTTREKSAFWWKLLVFISPANCFSFVHHSTIELKANGIKQTTRLFPSKVYCGVQCLILDSTLQVHP